MTDQDSLRANELENESLRDQFNDLLEAMEGITTFDPNREEGSYEALNQRIYEAVTDKPLLARIVLERGGSLLESACANLNLESSNSVIKCLIQARPSALLGPPGDDRPIDMIARHPQHCVLLLWIATNYPWVLDHHRQPPVAFVMLDRYSERRRNSCTSAILKDFFEAYPQALTQQHSDYNCNVLHYILESTQGQDGEECEADLFKWLADRCPSSTLSETDSNGNTPLLHACLLLSRTKTRNSNEICMPFIV